MKSTTLLFSLVSLALLLTNCKTDNDPVISAKIDSTYALLTDLRFEELKIINNTFKDPKITAAIQEYEKAKTTTDKIRIMDAFKKDIVKTDVTTDIPASKQQSLEFITHLNKISPESFDLAIQNNDVVAQQVKLVNTFFNDLDTGTLHAIAVYEKLSKEEKVKLLTDPTAFIPAPDYIQRYIGREFQRTYYFQRYLALERLNRYLLRRRFINEFPQGFKNIKDFGYHESAAYLFDLKLAKN